MNPHLRAVGVLHAIYGLLLLLLSITVFFGLDLAGSIVFLQGEQDAATLLGVIGIGVSGFSALLALPDLVGSWALLTERSWGQLFVLLFGFLRLIDIPFGTALGIYTIWAVLRHGDKVTRPSQIPAVAHT